MTTVRVTIDSSSTIGRIETARVDATTEADIERHLAKDETDAMLDAATALRTD